MGKLQKSTDLFAVFKKFPQDLENPQKKPQTIVLFKSPQNYWTSSATIGKKYLINNITVKKNILIICHLMLIEIVHKEKYQTFKSAF